MNVVVCFAEDFYLCELLQHIYEDTQYFSVIWLSPVSGQEDVFQEDYVDKSEVRIVQQCVALSIHLWVCRDYKFLIVLIQDRLHLDARETAQNEREKVSAPSWRKTVDRGKETQGG